MEIDLNIDLLKKIFLQQEVLEDISVLNIIKERAHKRGLLDEYMTFYREAFLKN